MSDWPDQAEACAACTGSPDAYGYGGRGYCIRCYRLLRRVEKIRKWDRNDPSTLEKFVRENLWTINSEERLEAVREECLRQLNNRLAVLKRREQIRRCEVEVDGLRLETQFGRLLHLVRPGARQTMNASYLSENFGEQERRVIYALLEQVLEQRPWRGFQWSPIWRKVFEGNDGLVGSINSR